MSYYQGEWRRLVQTEHIRVRVGEDGVEYWMPRGLLCRSQVFVESHHHRSDLPFQFRDVTPDIFNLFFSWSYTPDGSFPSCLAADEGLQLLHMAQIYEIVPLANRMRDLFRRQFLDGSWTVTPGIVKAGYAMSQPQTRTRDLFARSLAMSDALVEGKKKKSAVSPATWAALLDQVDGLAKDWALASLHKRALLSETSVCHFHDHRVVASSVSKRYRLTIHRQCPHEAKEWFAFLCPDRGESWDSATVVPPEYSEASVDAMEAVPPSPSPEEEVEEAEVAESESDTNLELDSVPVAPSRGDGTDGAGLADGDPDWTPL